MKRFNITSIIAFFRYHTDMRSTRTTTRYAFLLVLSGLLFILLAVLVKSGVLQLFDEDILVLLSARQTPERTLLLQTITQAGSIYLIAPVSVLVGYMLYRQNRKFDALLLLFSVTLAAVLARLLKFIVGRERPDLYTAMADTFTDLAFPSVHATQVTAFCLALLPLLRLMRPLTGWVIILLVFALTMTVMYSRLYLQLHYPSDIIGGVLLAIVCVTGVLVILARD